MTDSYIRDFYGTIYGILRTQANGDVQALDWPSQLILGTYVKAHDWTTDFYGRVVAQGNTVVSFIYEKHPELSKR